MMVEQSSAPAASNPASRADFTSFSIICMAAPNFQTHKKETYKDAGMKSIAL
jgi:hypothetical protein